MSKTINAKKLKLARETLRLLATGDLEKVAGGSNGSGCMGDRCRTVTTCYTDFCSE